MQTKNQTSTGSRKGRKTQYNFTNYPLKYATEISPDKLDAIPGYREKIESSKFQIPHDKIISQEVRGKKKIVFQLQPAYKLKYGANDSEPVSDAYPLSESNIHRRNVSSLSQSFDYRYDTIEPFDL